jgi:cytochrome c peroxidase
MSSAKVALGRRLFYDADLSADGSMACSTCHVQRHGFADGNVSHPGVHGDPARRNVPGLANVAWARPLTWGDPTVRTLEAQILVPVTGVHPVEMGMRGREEEIAARLRRNPCYVAMFRAAFPQQDGHIDMGNAAQALASFERSLLSTDAPYDRWRAGDKGALTPLQLRGAASFRAQCASCHSGPDLSDRRFHAVLPAVAADWGLAEISGRARDAGRFRTPSLRNVAVTAPYFHDGSAPTLASAVDRHGLARPLADRDAILAFLDALTDHAFLTDKRYALPGETCPVA